MRYFTEYGYTTYYFSGGVVRGGPLCQIVRGRTVLNLWGTRRYAVHFTWWKLNEPSQWWFWDWTPGVGPNRRVVTDPTLVALLEGWTEGEHIEPTLDRLAELFSETGDTISEILDASRQEKF